MVQKSNSHYAPSFNVDVFATTHLNQGVTLTLTFDLQHLTRSSVGASGYSL